MHGNKKFNTYNLDGEFGIGYTRKGEKFYFDLDDYDLIKDLCWYIESGGRVCARNPDNKTPFKLHRIVMQVENTNIEVDHIDHNQWDNRKVNLRPCSHKENMKNKNMLKSNTSGYIGVWFRKDTKRYTARIDVNGKTINLGCYGDIESALIARLTAEKLYYGEFSSQKELFERYNI